MQFVENSVLQHEYVVGTRIMDTDNCKGTVRYVGSVAASKNSSETWLGDHIRLSIKSDVFN